MIYSLIMERKPTFLNGIEDTIDSFHRSEIDRSVWDVLFQMKDPLGEPLFEIALGKLRRQGEIAVLDAGCGTGRSLVELRFQLMFGAGKASPGIRAVGVNLSDYSKESELVSVRQAPQNGSIEYLVADLETTELTPDSFDIIYSYETLVHNDTSKATRIVDNLLTALKPEGVLMFDISKGQKDRFGEYLRNEVPFGKYYIYAYDLKDRRKNQRTFVFMRKLKVLEATA